MNNDRIAWCLLNVSVTKAGKRHNAKLVLRRSVVEIRTDGPTTAKPVTYHGTIQTHGIKKANYSKHDPFFDSGGSPDES